MWNGGAFLPLPTKNPLSFLPDSHSGYPLDTMGGPSAALPNPRITELSVNEVTLLDQLSERRDSSTSTISSTYTVSRRSSGISPYFSSRRSSEASQFGNRPNNTSSADSYDPISTDASRRSSDASQCSGIQGLLHLTPAQQYRLKAKYAAATGGPPPTPLPNMERMSLKNRISLLDGAEPALPSFRHLPGPRRCSDSNTYGYGAPAAFPCEVGGNHARRASDPVRRPPGDPSSLLRVHRFNTTNMNPLHSPLDRRNFSLSGYAHSDGNLTRHMYSPRPPSISENIAMEAISGEADGSFGEDDIVLPDDVVQYIKSQSNGMAGGDSSIGDGQSFQVSAKGQPNGMLNQRRMAVSDVNMNRSAPVTGGCQMNFGTSSNMCKNMPVQWNEVSSGTVDPTSAQAEPPFPPRNLAVVHQKHNFSQYQNFSHQQPQMGQNMDASLQQFMHKNASMGGQKLNCVHLKQQQANLNPNNNPDLNSHEGYSQAHQMLSPNAMSRDLNQFPSSCHNVVMNPASHGHSQLTAAKADPHAVVMGSRECTMHNQVMQESGNQQSFSSQPTHLNFSVAQEVFHQPSAPMTSNQTHFERQPDMIGALEHNFTPSVVQPHPPSNPNPANRYRGIRAMQQLGYIRTPHPSTDVSPGQDKAETTPKRINGMASSQPRPCNSNMRESHLMHYYGQIHMYEQNGNFNNHADCSLRQQQCALNVKPATMPSPGANQVSSTVDSQVLEPPQIDFDAIMDDGDHSSLMSGTLSPSILQNLSQNSSRLTTPRNSLTLPSIPAGIKNMAIGDMSSMLTTLAEESKFLNMMS